MKITVAEFRALQRENAGYCRNCDEITRFDCEPDAHDYRCPECDQCTVSGIETAALIEETVEIID